MLRILLFAILLVSFISLSLSAHADDQIWTGANSDQFTDAGNWDGGVPGGDEDLFVVDGGSNLPVVIPESVESITVGGFQLGTSGEAGGQVVQNGGTLIVAPLNNDGSPHSLRIQKPHRRQGQCELNLDHEQRFRHAL